MASPVASWRLMDESPADRRSAISSKVFLKREKSFQRISKISMVSTKRTSRPGSFEAFIVLRIKLKSNLYISCPKRVAFVPTKLEKAWSASNGLGASLT